MPEAQQRWNNLVLVHSAPVANSMGGGTAASSTRSSIETSDIPAWDLPNLYWNRTLDERANFDFASKVSLDDFRKVSEQIRKIDEHFRGRQELPANPNTSDEMADITREEMKAEIAAAEARSDTKIARIEGKLDLVLEAVRSSREDARNILANANDNRRAVITNGWVIFGALVVAVGIMFTVAPAIFDLGFKWRETISREVQDQYQRNAPPRPPSTNPQTRGP
jgi:hypothetical protein